MSLQWQCQSVPIEDEEAVSECLRAMWEPFAIYKGEIWLKKMAQVEDDEPQSSTRHHNWAGTEMPE